VSTNYTDFTNYIIRQAVLENDFKVRVIREING